MIFYGVADWRTTEVVEFFVERIHAERFIADCLADEPEWRDSLTVEVIEFETSPN